LDEDELELLELEELLESTELVEDEL